MVYNICKIVKWIDPELFCNAERCVFILISCDCSGTSDSERLLLPLCCLQRQREICRRDEKNGHLCARQVRNSTAHCSTAEPNLHSQKRASCSKSASTKPISGCVRFACSGLMITSLLQVVNRLAASCEPHAGLMQVVSSTYSKSANIKLQQV